MLKIQLNIFDKTVLVVRKYALEISLAITVTALFIFLTLFGYGAI